MKHILSAALLCGVAVLSAQAQNVVITDKDGMPHRFKVDRVQEITFEKIGEPIEYDFQFDRLTVNPYGQKNIGLDFTTGEASVSLDLYQPEAYFLQEGTYTVKAGNGDYTIDPGKYSFVKINGTDEQLESGDMIVSLSGETYTFDMTFKLVSGAVFKGKYNGQLNVYGPVLNFNMIKCRYVTVNQPASNGFYYRFEDGSIVEMRIDLFSDGEVPAPGTYTFSDTMENGTASSIVDLFSPYNVISTKFTEGTVTISGEGDDTVVDIDGKLEIGIPVKASYKGALPSRPTE